LTTLRSEFQDDRMAGSLLVAPTGGGVGLTRACLGLLRALDRRGVAVAYLKPVAGPGPGGVPDRSTALVAAVSTLKPPEPLPAALLEQQVGLGRLDEAVEKVVAVWQPVSDQADVVVVEGASPVPAAPYADELNHGLARALNAGVVLVCGWPPSRYGSGKGAASQVAESLAIAAGGYRSGEGSRVAGCVVTGVPARDPAAPGRLRAELDQRGLRLAGTVPHRIELTWPRVIDLVRELKPRVLHEGDMSRRTRDVAVFAQGIPGGLRLLADGRLIVVPGDRHEVIMAACLAALGGTQLAGLLLSAGVEPDPRIRDLTRAAHAAGLPLLLTRHNSYQTAARVGDLDPGLPADDSERVEAVTECAADALDGTWLESLASPSRPRRLSPAAFRYRLTELARAAGARLVLPEGTEPRIVRAAVACVNRGIARSVLLGPADQVAQAAARAGLQLPDGIAVIDPRTVADRYVGQLARIRRDRGWTEEVAREHLADPVTVATMMVWNGDADGMVCGAAHTTAATVRPALQILGTGPGSRLVSSVFFMCLPDEVVIYGDCAINPDPDADDLADIAIQSAASARAFGIEPRVAMVSISTGAAGRDVDKVTRATAIARQREPGLAIDGPLQYDAAAIASVAAAKRPGSPVAGRPNVFIFPDLDTGNTTYKAVQRSADVVSIGPMLQGLARPVNDLSRGATVEDISYTMALTAVQSRARQPASRHAASPASGREPYGASSAIQQGDGPADTRPAHHNRLADPPDLQGARL
jgi:phosphate acetyltransferase